MPKNNTNAKKRSKGALPNLKKEEVRSVGSDDIESINADNQSVTSLTSWNCGSDDTATLGNDNNIEDTENSSYIDDFEDKFKEAIDGTNGKSAKTRQQCLDAIRKALVTRFCWDLIMERKMTIADMLERSLKRKGEELGSAALLSCVIFVTMGTCNETDALFSDLMPHLISSVNDNCVPPAVRSKCALALSLGCFITSNGIESMETIMDLLQSIFAASFFKGNGAIPNHTSEVLALHSSALYSWTLLLTIHTPSTAIELSEKHLSKITELLDSPDLELRIAAGECIAVLYEIARESDEEFEVEEMDMLCDKLRMLATDSQKFRAKKDRRQQRSSFRDILRAVEEREPPAITVKFGKERLVIDTWCRKRQYDAICYVLKSGMNLHLSENELLRDIFELGPPLSNLDVSNKLSKFERNMSNIASCKARTKSRGKLRDKRADVLS